jgi:hypothetical protein
VAHFLAATTPVSPAIQGRIGSVGLFCPVITP